MSSEFLPLPAGYRMSEFRRASVRPKKELELRTFDDWSKAGFKILKGSKHVGRNPDGVALFSSAQVEKYVAYLPSEDDEGDQWEGEEDLPGNPYDYGHN